MSSEAMTGTDQGETTQAATVKRLLVHHLNQAVEQAQHFIDQPAAGQEAQAAQAAKTVTVSENCDAQLALVNSVGRVQHWLELFAKLVPGLDLPARRFYEISEHMNDGLFYLQQTSGAPQASLIDTVNMPELVNSCQALIATLEPAAQPASDGGRAAIYEQAG